MPRHTGIHPENRRGTGVNLLDAQNLMLKITQSGYSKACPACCNVIARVKLDDKDADEEDDGKALADEGYSYIRELEYQDALEEEEEDDEETQPAKKCVNLGDEDSDEEDDDEDMPPLEFEEKDTDEEEEEEVRQANKCVKLEDVRMHLIQVRKAIEAREARSYEKASKQIVIVNEFACEPAHRSVTCSHTFDALHTIEAGGVWKFPRQWVSSTDSLVEVNDEATERNPADAAPHEENPSGSSSSSGRNERKRSHTHA